jgi:hypothetical protein
MGSQYSGQEGFLVKKILIAVLIIGVVAAIAVGGTAAYFASNNNVGTSFSTSTFNVTASATSVPFEFTGLVPGGPAVVKYVNVVNSGDVSAYIKATTGNWWEPNSGSNALLNALQVKVTLVGNLTDPVNGGTYPNGNTYLSYEGPLVGLTINNVDANNPILPGQWGAYKVEVSLPFGARDNSIQGTTAGCDLIFNAVQAPGQSWPSIVW